MKSNYQIFTFCCFLFSCFLGNVSFANNGAPTNIEKENDKTVKQTIFETLNTADVLTVTIKTAVDSLIINKKSAKSFPATLSYIADSGFQINQNIEISARGRSRRKVCDFPPLKVKFSKKELITQGLRTNHKSLKLVTHCNDLEGAEQNVLEEFLAYKIYNELTNNSLKVQLIKVNYEDTNSDNAFMRYAFLIEDIDELAERLDGKEVEGFGMKITSFGTEEMNTFAMFQYMIGNEDWRIPFMRNIKFIQPNNGNALIPVPYDFDASGLVFADYAKPDRDLKLSSVQQRAFMGVFENKNQRAASIQLFKDKKDKIYQLVQNFPSMPEVGKMEILDYLDGFYEIIHSQKLFKKALPLKGKVSVPTGDDGRFSK